MQDAEGGADASDKDAWNKLCGFVKDLSNHGLADVTALKGALEYNLLVDAKIVNEDVKCKDTAISVINITFHPHRYL
jgi:hypothetical protein